MFQSIHGREFSQAIMEKLNKYARPITENPTATLHREKIYHPDLYYLLHYKKFPSSLLETLYNYGYIKQTDSEGWVAADERIAHIYMNTLAEYTARYDLQDMIIGTESLQNINELYPRQYSISPASTNGKTFMVNFTNCLPIPSPDVSFEKLLDFKESHQDDLLELRQKIRELEQSISASESYEEAKSIIAAFTEKWQSELMKAEKMFHGNRIPLIFGNLLSFISCSSAAITLSQWLGNHNSFSSSAVITNAAIGMSGMLGVRLENRNYQNRIRREQENSGFAYIINAAQDDLLKSW